MRRFFLIGILACGLFACESKTDEDGRPTKVAGQKVPTESEVKAAAKGAGPADCKTFYEESQKACHDVFYEGLDINCHMLFTKVKLARTQMKGDLFKDPDGKVSHKKIGGTTCKLHVKSLRKKRAKKDGGMKTQAWGPQCKEYLAHLESICINKMSTGDYEDRCSSLLMAVGRLEPGDMAEKTCEMNLGFAKKKK